LRRKAVPKPFLSSYLRLAIDAESWENAIVCEIDVVCVDATIVAVAATTAVAYNSLMNIKEIL
jgi:hypothetical protein